MVSPTDKRMFVLAAALKADYSIDKLYNLTKIDKWFLHKFNNIIKFHKMLENSTEAELTKDLLLIAKKLGFSDKQIAVCLETTELLVRRRRKEMGMFTYIILCLATDLSKSKKIKIPS